MRKAIVIITLSLAVFYYYFYLGLFFIGKGYYHPEAIFLIEKALLALKGNPPRLENIGLIYPPLPFFVLFPFIFINPLTAPIFASSLGMSFLTAMLSYRIFKRKLPTHFFILMLLLLFFNPAILYVSSSGSSAYLYLVFLTLFFVFIFEYYEHGISFYLAMAGVFIGILVLIRYEIIFILSTWIFASLILSIETTLGRDVTYRNFLNLLLKLPAYRQTFLRKMMAVYMMIFIPPIFAFLSWIYLNWIFTSNPFHFLNSPYSYFRTLRTYALFNPFLLEIKGDIIASSFQALKDVFLYSPIYFVFLFAFGRRIFFVLALLSLYFALVISAFFGLSLLNTDYFAPFLTVSFVVFIYACEERKGLRKNIITLAFVITLVISFISSYQRLKRSNYPEEKMFANVLTGGSADGIFRDEIEIANFLRKFVPDAATVLLDDANGYPIIVFHGDPKNFILPYQYEFTSVVVRPEVYADFVVVYNPEKFEGKRDAINAIHEKLFYYGGEDLLLVYSTENWRIYRSQYKIRTVLRLERAK